MEHYRSLADLHLNNVWLTIGSFDGVHLGHQAILSQLTAEAHENDALAVVLTFYPHPAVVLGKKTNHFYLNSPDERATLLGEQGIDIVITHNFDATVAATPAFEFISKLHQKLGLSHLLVGPDFALGHNREGDIPTLRRYGQNFEYKLEVVSTAKIAGEVVSSSRIRSFLFEGDIASANQFLGRPYRLQGVVIQGDGRGKTIGIPTANLQVWEHKVIPKAGVYICQAELEGKRFQAVTNIGVRPTFENQPVSPRVETFLLDFDRDIYGQKIDLAFLARLRDERRFSDVATLVSQIYTDIEQARHWFRS